MMGVYAIRNVRNGRVYVGSGVSLDHRWSQHKCELRAGRHHSIRLQRAWDKHGADAFAFVVLEEVADVAALRAAEQRWLDELGGFDPERGYNSHPLATGHVPGWRHSDATRRHFARIRKGEKHPNAKLRDTDIYAIMERLANGETVASVARSYGVTGTTITDIKRGRSYPHVPVPRMPGGRKGQRGERHGMAKLSDAAVADIRARLAAGESQASIARLYGVDQSTVSNIATGKRRA